MVSGTPERSDYMRANMHGCYRDTVASVGVIRSKTLPFTTANTTIKTFRHALSLDEHRVKFRPNLYHRPPAEGTVAPQGHVVRQQPTGVPIPHAHKRGRPSQDSAISGLTSSPVKSSPTDMVPPSKAEDEEDTHSEVVEEEDMKKEGCGEAETRHVRATSEGNERKKQRNMGSRVKERRSKFNRSEEKKIEKAERTALKDEQKLEKKKSRKKFFVGRNPIVPRLTNLNDPADDNVGETDVKEVWFAGCHSGTCAPNAFTYASGY